MKLRLIVTRNNNEVIANLYSEISKYMTDELVEVERERWFVKVATVFFNKLVKKLK